MRTNQYNFLKFSHSFFHTEKKKQGSFQKLTLNNFPLRKQSKYDGKSTASQTEIVDLVLSPSISIELLTSQPT